MDAVAVSELVLVGTSGIVLDLGLVIEGSGVPLAVLGFVMDGSVAVTFSLVVLSLVGVLAAEWVGVASRVGVLALLVTEGVSVLVSVGGTIVTDLGFVMDGNVKVAVPLAVLGLVMDGGVAVPSSLAVVLWLAVLSLIERLGVDVP